ncbi:Oxysterol-binding protein 4 [Xanthoria calcicola]
MSPSLNTVSSGPTKDEGGGVAPQNKGSWSSFLKSIASFNGDLSSMTAPPFILGTLSLTEFSAYWTQHPSVFVAPAAEKDPAKRAMLVLKWFLSTLKPSYSTRNDKYGSEKKPLNPFLGELFLGKWEDEAGTTELVSEQVSHHPPVTAYCIQNPKHGIKLEGYNGQKASFSRTIHIKQIGHALLTLTPPDNPSAPAETYLITLPNIHIEGLIYGKPFVELNSCTYISSSTGYTGKIDYSGKGWVSGKKNSFTATLYPTGKEKDILYTVDGQWPEAFTIREGSGKHGTVIDNYNSRNAPITPLIVPALEQQDPWEANKAWEKVITAITKGDMDTTNAEKSKIENAQREYRRREQSEGREWERKFFTRSDKAEDWWESLAKGMGERIEAEKTGGVWRFDKAKAETARRPFHEGLSPTG